MYKYKISNKLIDLFYVLVTQQSQLYNYGIARHFKSFIIKIGLKFQVIVMHVEKKVVCCCKTQEVSVTLKL